MVLTKDRSSEKLIAVVDHNNIKETYECSMSICPNPSCTCGIVGLTFIPVHGEDRKDNTASSITVKINIEKQSLADDDSISQEEYDFGKELFNQLQKEDFALLEQEQIAYKRRIVQDDELTSLNIEFPIKDIELEGLMFGYNEILPYEKSLAFSLDGHDYPVLDQYCLRPQCSCTEAVLSFYLIDGGIRSGKESFDYLTDYKKRTWDYVKESIYKENIPDMITVRNAIEQQEPDIYEELQKRHRHLKILYTNWRKRRGPTQQNLPISRKAVGRNEPCPCGSGKKYKKCCGRV